MLSYISNRYRFKSTIQTECIHEKVHTNNIQNHCLLCKQLEQILSKIRSALDKHGKNVDPQFNEDYKTLSSGCDNASVPTFMKLFWGEQQK